MMILFVDFFVFRLQAACLRAATFCSAWGDGRRSPVDCARVLWDSAGQRHYVFPKLHRCSQLKNPNCLSQCRGGAVANWVGALQEDIEQPTLVEQNSYFQPGQYWPAYVCTVTDQNNMTFLPTACSGCCHVVGFIRRRASGCETLLQYSNCGYKYPH